MTQAWLFKSCMCATGCLGQNRLAPGYVCTPELVAEYHARDFKTGERRGWERLSAKGAEKVFGQWRHESGRELRHCGHPTANFPYYGTDLDGSMILAPNGRGFQKLIYAQEFIEKMPLPNGAPRATVASHTGRGPTQGPEGNCMATKKKQAPKTDKALVAIGRPHVDVKTGDKVPIYFNRETNNFQAELAYEIYTAATFPALEGKLTSAFANGARLEASWIPGIVVADGADAGEFGIEVDRKLFLQKGEKVIEARWGASPQEKAKELKGAYGRHTMKKGQKFQLPWADTASYYGADCILPYNEELYGKLVEARARMKVLETRIQDAIKKANVQLLLETLHKATSGIESPIKLKPAPKSKATAVALQPGSNGVKILDCRKCVARANGTAEPKKHSKSCPNRRTNVAVVGGRQRLTGVDDGKPRENTDYGTAPDYENESQESTSEVA